MTTVYVCMYVRESLISSEAESLSACTLANVGGREREKRKYKYASLQRDIYFVAFPFWSSINRIKDYIILAVIIL